MNMNINSKRKRKRLQTFTNPNIIYNIDSNAPRMTIALRVKPSTYMLYHSLNREQKRILRDIIDNLIVSFNRKKDKIVANANMIFNININQAKIESGANIDPEILNKKLKILEQEKRELLSICKSYEKEINRLETENKELLKEIRKLEEKMREYEQTLNLIVDVLRDDYYGPEKKLQAIENILRVR